MKPPISISNITSVSALGNSPEEVWESYVLGTPRFHRTEFQHKKIWISKLAETTNREITTLQKENTSFKNLDRSVLMAILSARKTLNTIPKIKNTGVNIGSSRGATALFEYQYSCFEKNKQVSPYSSPTTTLGNISSWVGKTLELEGIHIDHSITCSTGLHSILNGIAWLKADMASQFLAGGTEAALTPFTYAQMDALKLYTTSPHRLACESMNFQKKMNTLVLGEAAGITLLEKEETEDTQALIIGYGVGTDSIAHSASISKNADCFQKSMRMAMLNAHLKKVDAIVMHAPGTIKGDLSEYNAILKVFGDSPPLLTSNKWIVGHTFATSGVLSIEMAVLMLKKNLFIENPFYKDQKDPPSELKTIMVNAVGFGGNAISIIISKP